MGLIHKTALVSPTAQLHPTVEVGAYSIIGDHVCIDAGTRVGPHCVIDGHTNIGKNNEFYRFCSIGGIPQDKKYAGEPTRLEIGRSEEHTSELQSRGHLVCRLLLEKKKQ